MRKRIVVSGLCLFLALSVPAMALQQQPLPLGDLQVSADSLGTVILGENVKLMMRDGTYVEGKVLRASREEVFLKVRKSEPTGALRGPEAGLKTADIATVNMQKKGSVAAAIALGVVGGVLGLLLAELPLRNVESEFVAAPVEVAGATGGAVAGAVLGRHLARKTITISVVSPAR